MSALATVTKKIGLSHIVLCNLFRHPALLAKMASTLDIISGGRFVLSIGAGWLKEECHRYGIDWFPYKERIERLRESIQIMKMLWTEEKADFNGRYYRLEDAMLEPKPVTKPHPPIWLAGASDSVMRMVADEGDGWDISWAGSPKAAKAKVESLAAYCDEISRKADRITISHTSLVVLSENREQAMRLARAKARDLNATVESFMDRHLVGSPGEIASRINEYVEAGVRHFTLYFDRDLRNLDLFASEITPLVG
jgi:alkanesulfonate monooxygenase SsuD/methylene tetrahydromethanopterin reductase-like flavin-dependent oxidoreductase (luciferase family)